MTIKPEDLSFAPSADQNKEVILDVLKEAFAECRQVLEIGSGTGQHAVFFSEQLPHLHWQPTDQAERLADIQARCEYFGNERIATALALSVQSDWPPLSGFDAAYSANTAHIMSWEQVGDMFAGLGRVLIGGGRFALYGPFHYGGKATAESNARFDQALRAESPHMGVRNFEDLEALAEKAGMRLWKDYAMPADNHTLVWEKI